MANQIGYFVVLGDIAQKDKIHRMVFVQLKGLIPEAKHRLLASVQQSAEQGQRLGVYPVSDELDFSYYFVKISRPSNGDKDRIIAGVPGFTPLEACKNVAKQMQVVIDNEGMDGYTCAGHFQDGQSIGPHSEFIFTASDAEEETWEHLLKTPVSERLRPAKRIRYQS